MLPEAGAKSAVGGFACGVLDTRYSNVNPGNPTLNARVLMPKILRYYAG